MEPNETKTETPLSLNYKEAANALAKAAQMTGAIIHVPATGINRGMFDLLRDVLPNRQVVLLHNVEEIHILHSLGLSTRHCKLSEYQEGNGEPPVPLELHPHPGSL